MGKERGSAEKTIKTIRRKTRRQYAAEDKTRIVMEGLYGEETVAELCCCEGIAQSLSVRLQVMGVALEQPEKSPRELAYHTGEDLVRLQRAALRIPGRARCPDQMGRKQRRRRAGRLSARKELGQYRQPAHPAQPADVIYFRWPVIVMGAPKESARFTAVKNNRSWLNSASNCHLKLLPISSTSKAKVCSFFQPPLDAAGRP